MKQTRADYAGCKLGVSITRVVDLMYQNRTAVNFMKGLMAVLTPYKKHRIEMLSHKKGSHA
jgi:hypothetical protein